MNIKDIKSIYKFIKGTDIVELEVEGPDGKVKIKRGTPSAITPQQVLAASQPAPVEAPVVKEKTVPDNVKIVTSPMVGTFYAAPAPDAGPYVKVGDEVKVGQVLCIIEAMKLMNEIEADSSGTVVKILIENAQPVEYNQSLFYIDANK